MDLNYFFVFSDSGFGYFCFPKAFLYIIKLFIWELSNFLGWVLDFNLPLWNAFYVTIDSVMLCFHFLSVLVIFSFILVSPNTHLLFIRVLLSLKKFIYILGFLLIIIASLWLGRMQEIILIFLTLLKLALHPNIGSILEEIL